MGDMEPYFGCWIPRKFDDEDDVVMNLVVFCAFDIESMSDQGGGTIRIVFTLSLSCTTCAEHVFRFENNVFILHSIPSLIPHMQGKCIPKRKFPMIKQNSQVGTFVEVESLHGRRKHLSQNLSCPALDWRGRRQTDPYIDRLYILFRIAGIDSDTYWIYSVSGIDYFVDEVTCTRDVERANRR
jgi:hypothetical protein